MRRSAWALLAAAAAWVPAGCSGPAPQKPKAAPAKFPSPPRITQFYTTAPSLPRGEKGLLCYGVENTQRVWLSPPRQELSAALARCIEITPSGTTTYRLTAEGAGKSVTKELTVAVGPAAKPKAKIIDITVSSLSVRRGDPVSICYRVSNAVSVRIDPIRFRAGAEPKGCAMDQPRETTTYTITAKGSDSQDTEHVTVKVQ
ncbi:MAG: hypothetical protein LAQ30_21320 [Acidobacteriia bacterium]|nr:hypothetical protein [Terriglobia bacterium]